MKRCWTLLGMMTLAGCVSRPVDMPQITPTPPPSTVNEAQATLVTFFDLLNAKQYSEADPLYGGSYETLWDWNPDVDPSDHVTLWRRACEQNGLQCLTARSVTFKELQGDTYIFQVEFSNPDGSLFVRGPCCGGSATDFPPESRFKYGVQRTTKGKFLVTDMPPYVP